MGQIVEKQPERDPNHQSRRKPAVEDEREEVEFRCGQNNHRKHAPFEPPLHQFPAFPKAALEKEPLVIKKPWRDQPQRPEGADDVIRIILGIVHMGVVLQVNPGENWETETQQQS